AEIVKVPALLRLLDLEQPMQHFRARGHAAAGADFLKVLVQEGLQAAAAVPVMQQAAFEVEELGGEIAHGRHGRRRRTLRPALPMARATRARLTAGMRSIPSSPNCRAMARPALLLENNLVSVSLNATVASW